MTVTANPQAERLTAATETDVSAAASPRWLAMAGIGVSAASGLALIATSFVLSRRGDAPDIQHVIYWVGFFLLVAPIAWRICGREIDRTERLFLACLLGMGLYGIKVLHDPYQFVIPDEFSNWAPAIERAGTHSVFPPVRAAGAAAFIGYPGLQLAADSLSYLTGLSIFASGLLTIAAARLMVTLALFLLVEAILEDSFLAGLAALMFMANPNYTFWEAQFSYESLALPLLIATLCVLASRARGMIGRRGGAGVILVLAATLTATHHLTAYVLAGALVLVSLASRRAAWRAYRIDLVAVCAVAMTGVWFFAVAPATSSYLGAIGARAARGIESLMSSGAVRLPFSRNQQVLVTASTIEQAISYGSVLVIIGGVLMALARPRRLRPLATPIGALLLLAGVVFVVLFPLRLSAGAWEAANRGQELSAAGMAVLVGLGLMRLGGAGGRQGLTRAVQASALAIAIAGGVCQGWPVYLLVPPPVKVTVGGTTLQPQSKEVADWAVSSLGKNHVYLADEISGRYLMLDGAQFTILGDEIRIPGVIKDSWLAPFELDYLYSTRVDYVVFDRRRINMESNNDGYYFPSRSSAGGGHGYFAKKSDIKFLTLPGVSRVMNSDGVSIYDLRKWRASHASCGALQDKAMRWACLARGTAR